MVPNMPGPEIVRLKDVVANCRCTGAASVSVEAERLLPDCDRMLGGALAPARQ